MNDENKGLMNADEVTEYLGISKPTLYKLIKEEGLPAVKLGRAWKFRRSSLESWIEEQENKKKLSNSAIF